MILYIVLIFTNLGIALLFLFSLPSVAGIATTLVNVRVGLGQAVGEERQSAQTDHELAFGRNDVSHQSESQATEG